MKSQYQYRRIASAGLAAVLAVLTVACTSSTTPSQPGQSLPARQPSTITYWSRGANEAINQQLVDAWNASHETKIDFLPVPDADYAKKLAAAVQAGNPPDVVTVDVAAMPEMMRGGVLLDISEKAKALPYFDKLVKSYIDYSTTDGKIYALPENIDASSMFWNKDLFKAAGLDPEKPPTTFAEIIEYSKKITELDQDTHGFWFSGQCGGCVAYTQQPLIWASGGDRLDPTGKTATINDPAVVTTLQLYQDLWKKGYVPAEAETDTGANWVNSFGSGKIGISMLGAFAIAQMTANFPDVNYGIAPIPGKDGGQSSFTGGDVVAIPAASKNPDAAWEFLQWSLTEPAQVEVYAKSGSLVARSDLIGNQYMTDPNVIAENNVALVGRMPVWYKNNAEIDSATTGPYPLAWQEIVFKGADAQSTLDKANADMQRLLDQG